MSHLDSAAILDDFDRSDVMVTSFDASTVDLLGRTSQTSATVPRTPVVHTTPERELAMFPEATRPREAITIYDTIPYSADERRPAEVLYQGRTYRVLKTADYAEHGDVFIMVAGLVDT